VLKAEEAGIWKLAWLLRAVAEVPAQARIMYSITGENRPTEWKISPTIFQLEHGRLLHYVPHLTVNRLVLNAVKEGDQDALNLFLTMSN
jgi:hypothetical protein